jgi:hypothetical protein
MGCSNDLPTTLNNDAVLHITGAPPAEGIVVEGVSVPGIALGSTRAEVEEAYGDDTLWCQSNGAPGNRAYCAWAVTGGGQVHVHFRSPDGGVASDSTGDVASVIEWTEAVGGWTTTAGVSTTLARENPQAVIDAYPNARVSRFNSGAIHKVIDYPLGISFRWDWIIYSSGQTHITASIFYPREPPPLPEPLTHVYDIDMFVTKTKGKLRVRGFIGVRNETQLAETGATVFARWTFPDGSTQAVQSMTSGSGWAHFEINDAPRGICTITVEDVVTDGREFDPDNSVLSDSILAK